jgi:sugar lactone lactonase YvrE
MGDGNERSFETVAEGLAFTEGPRWHGGALWFSDFFTLGVYRVVPGGEVEQVCEVPAGPSGLGFDPQDRLLVVSMGDRRILRLEADGNLVEHADLSGVAPGSLNDMVVGPDGAAYVGNLGAMAPALGEPLPPTPLVYVDPEGEPRLVGEPLYAPNGSVFTDGGKTLVVAETLAARIVAFTIEPDGDLTDKRVWAQLGPEPTVRALFQAMETGPIPDGVTIDSEGALWVGNAGGPVLRVAPGGETLDSFKVPGNTIYAVALGGEDLRTLYMCVAPPLLTYRPGFALAEGLPDTGSANDEREGKVLACRVDVPGISQ